MPEITFRGSTLFYDLINPNAKTKIIYLSSILTYSPTMDFFQQTEALQNDCCIIIPHRPGYGHSEMVLGKRDFSNILEEIKYILMSIKLKDNLILVGHGLGAPLALAYAKKYGEGIDRVIVINPLQQIRSPFVKQAKIFLKGMLGSLKAVKKTNPSLIKQRLIMNNKCSDEILTDAYNTYLYKIDNFCVVKEFSRINHQISDAYKHDKELDKIRIYVVYNNKEEKIAKYLLQTFSKIEAIKIDSLDDYLHYDKPSEITNIILKAI